MAQLVPTEAQEGEMLVQYLRLKGLRFTHIPMETGGSPEAKRRAIRMKRQGASRGVPDYFILTPNGLVAIELKRIKGSRTTPEQTAWIQELNMIGVDSYIAKGANEAIDIIEKYLGGKKNDVSKEVF